MIVVVGRVKSDAQRREELIRVAQALARASRDEQGCAGYRFYEDTEGEHDFVFVEEWENEEALQRHFRTSHIAEFMSSVRATLLAPPDVRFHTVASTRDISEMTAS
jgi:quinol monooxygenase YgiN